ncbi:MAG: class I SAM-dependent methyltransferase [Methanocella sp.]
MTGHLIIRDWEEVYHDTPPWDIGRPQPAFEGLVKDREIKPGRILDSGCGTGENALLLAQNGSTVTGIDLAGEAIARAKTKAKERHIAADFVQGNVTGLDRYFSPGSFDTAIDCGLFHVLSDEDRPVYAGQVREVLKPGGGYFMLCFSDKEPGTWGPRRVSAREIEQIFSPLFSINYIKDSYFLSRSGDGNPKAYLLSATKI